MDNTIPHYYSHEQKLRRAWILKYQKITGYHTATDEKKESVLNETYNN